MATDVVHLWVTPESDGLKALSPARNGVSSQVEGGLHGVTAGSGLVRRCGSPARPKTGCGELRTWPTLVIVMQQLLFL